MDHCSVMFDVKLTSIYSLFAGLSNLGNNFHFLLFTIWQSSCYRNEISIFFGIWTDRRKTLHLISVVLDLGSKTHSNFMKCIFSSLSNTCCASGPSHGKPVMQFQIYGNCSFVVESRSFISAISLCSLVNIDAVTGSKFHFQVQTFDSHQYIKILSGPSVVSCILSIPRLRFDETSIACHLQARGHLRYCPFKTTPLTAFRLLGNNIVRDFWKGRAKIMFSVAYLDWC